LQKYHYHSLKLSQNSEKGGRKLPSFYFLEEPQWLNVSARVARTFLSADFEVGGCVARAPSPAKRSAPEGRPINSPGRNSWVQAEKDSGAGWVPSSSTAKTSGGCPTLSRPDRKGGWPTRHGEPGHSHHCPRATRYLTSTKPHPHPQSPASAESSGRLHRRASISTSH
jgi:hypothetical protein